MSIAVTLAALLIEAMFGYPDRVLRAIGHPVMWIGRMIASLDETLNREASGRRKAAGFVAAFLIVVLPGAAAYAVESVLPLLPFGLAIVAVLASSLIAQRSLYEHVERVATALEQQGLAGRPPGGVADRRPRSRRARRGGRRPRGDRKPRGELLRWRGRAGVLARGRRARRRRGLQGDQHRRQHDRSSHAAPCAISDLPRRSSTISSTCRRRGSRRC